jgi:hypothetical protein
MEQQDKAVFPQWPAMNAYLNVFPQGVQCFSVTAGMEIPATSSLPHSHSGHHSPVAHQ